MGDHTESIEIYFDPTETTYEQLLEVFWKSHNPTSHPWGRQYMAAVWYHNKKQKEAILASKAVLAAEKGKEIQTHIAKAGKFTVAEDYHQKYYLRSHQILVDALGFGDDDEAFVNSFGAAKLNSYVGGKGTPEQLREDLKEIDLKNQEAVEYITNLVENRKGRRFHCGS